MLASPLPTVTPASSPNTTAMTSVYTRQQRYYNDWPLNELEENVMTLATSIKLQQEQQQRQMAIKRCRSSVVRCNLCQRKFHSKGNLANHQQLYQH
ncbi:uncharacterized protein ATC70_010418 [Mucor velutinosus]|uniref:C2H2-type domain-containing protein n=1 Tax=Mucor velutinosus TaxID=708070 RepID=A0AAN7DIE8_9FUNG|nr:hypothetical protein ATC70_010418 [Mucor velutinosus]